MACYLLGVVSPSHGTLASVKRAHRFRTQKAFALPRRRHVSLTARRLAVHAKTSEGTKAPESNASPTGGNGQQRRSMFAKLFPRAYEQESSLEVIKPLGSRSKITPQPKAPQPKALQPKAPQPKAPQPKAPQPKVLNQQPSKAVVADTPAWIDKYRSKSVTAPSSSSEASLEDRLTDRSAWIASYRIKSAAPSSSEASLEARLKDRSKWISKYRRRPMTKAKEKAEDLFIEKTMEMAAQAKAKADRTRELGALMDEEAEPTAPTASLGDKAMGYIHKAVGVSLFFAADAYLKGVFLNAGIVFPSALGGMFIILGTLLSLQAVKPAIVQAIYALMQPGLEWIARWMPLFYVPTLIVLPIALRGIDARSLSTITGITVVGMILTLIFTAQMTMLVRKAVEGGKTGEGTEMGDSLFDDHKPHIAPP
eukprot:CAMPEP_0118957054 /NCGR_PEP_ID=MMETSP1169-20130426/61901_1 /TAXON_ID=36882 /ORGANISM="Pyramimonas obovata, Strain CCMP722" /LENGTH=422 /DNA_ID=CAMNT_0006905109 /DNA_START=44 /DNA_END=1308 /DNA_ORIENTATION=-